MSSEGVRALTIEGLTVVGVGVVGNEFRLCCAVPRAFARGMASQVVVTLGAVSYRVGLRCTGYDEGSGVAEFAVDLRSAAPLGFFFGLNAWELGGRPAGGQIGVSGRRVRYLDLRRRRSGKR